MKTETKESLDRYVNRGIPTGQFLRAVLCNNLVGAFSFGDDENLRDLHQIVMYVANQLPLQCWGSTQMVDDWIAAGGKEGLRTRRETASV